MIDLLKIKFIHCPFINAMIFVNKCFYYIFSQIREHTVRIISSLEATWKTLMVSLNNTLVYSLADQDKLRSCNGIIWSGISTHPCSVDVTKMWYNISKFIRKWHIYNSIYQKYSLALIFAILLVEAAGYKSS